MNQDDGIKIRTIPRSNKKKAEKPGTPRWIIYVGTSSAVLLAAVLFLDHKIPTGKGTVQQTNMSSVGTRQNASVTRHMQDSQIQRQLMVQAQQLENARFRTKNLEADPYAFDLSRNYGVQMDQDDTSSRIYEDLNGAKDYSESTPDEKISARLANRRWVNELERRERITFVRNFIKSAYENGYEVDIDQNLVVVGVRKRQDNKKLDIETIMDRFAARQAN